MGLILQLVLLLTCTCLYSSAQSTTTQTGPPLALPGDIWPQKYWVTMYVDPTPQSFSYWGTVTIEVLCTTDTNTIVINYCSLEIPISEIIVLSVDGDALQTLTVDQSNTYLDEENQLLVITVEEQLLAFGTYSVSINFYNGYLDYNLTGFYRSYYFDSETQTDKWLAVTQPEPAYGRCIFPSFDQPDMKAIFFISIGHHKSCVALSNEPIETTDLLPEKPDWVLDHFVKTGPRSTYQIAMIVSEFVSFNAALPPNDIVVGFWCRPDVQSQLEFASEIVVDALVFFGEYFNLPLTVLKFDIAVIPDFQSNGRDGFAMVTFRESDALFHPELSSVTDQANTALVVAHYMAKTWIGDIVTQQTWDGVWMKEGFCNYFARIYIDNKFPDWKPMVIEIVVALLETLSADGLLAAHPLYFPVEKLTQVDLLSDTISFRKGSLMARLVSTIVGQDVFQQAMAEYVSTYKGSNTQVEFLWDIITNMVQSSNILPDGIDLTTIMNGWIYEPHYPILIVEIDDQGLVTVSQEAYIFNPSGENTNNPCWWLPLYYTTSAELNFENPSIQWLQCEGATLDVQLGPDDFLILNVGLIAPCRVDYGKNMWENINRFVLDEQSYLSLDVFTRVQLISDLYGAAWIGRVSYTFMFETLWFLQYETEYAVWRAAWYHLSALRLMLAKTDLRPAIQQYGRSLAAPIFEKFGNINDFPVDDPYNTRFKTYFLSWFCAFVAKACQEPAAQLFQEWYQSADPYNSNPINPNIRITAYCQGIVVGGKAEWEFLFAQYLSSNVPSEKSALQRALGCSQEEATLRQYLEYSIDTSYVRPQDSIIIFTGMATSDASVLVARQFFYERFQEIYTVHRGNQAIIGRYLTTLYSRIMTTEELQEMENFIESVSDQLSSADLRLNEARSMADDNISWHQRNYDEVAQALQQYMNS